MCIRDSHNGQLGNVYVKYLKPINVREYLDSTGFQILQSKELETAALSLTQTLLRMQ